MRFAASFILLVTILLSSCGEKSKREVAIETGLFERLEAFQIESEQIGASMDLTADSFELPSGTSLDPLPRTEAPDPNTLLISLSQLISITSSEGLTDDNRLNLNVSRFVPDLLGSSYSGREPANESWLEGVEAVLATRYLAILAPYGYQPPKLHEKHYEGGKASVIVSLYDRDAKKHLLRFSVSAQATGTVEATTEERRLDDALTYEVNQALRDSLLEKIRQGLTQRTGGNFGSVATIETPPQIE